ncbi:hypothetical protein [Marisediminicola sp. LYQ134]|uniref:hypothetical protein n=1 Tax=unclassified Marisediminicola TaxID=2618316 RepID=UPI003982E322
MIDATGEERPPLRVNRLAVWTVALVLLAIGFVSTIVALNSTVYSSSGFVSGYLAALERRDVDSALETPGVDLPEGDHLRTLLAPGALGELRDHRIRSDTVRPDGTHRVIADYTIDGTESSTVFEVTFEGTRFGLFTEWSFTTSPVSVLDILPRNDARFDANGTVIISDSGAGEPVSALVLTPGSFALGHESTYLVAEPETILVVEPASVVEATVTARANNDFIDLLQTELDSLLDECATQTVLQPTGCPFGQPIANRLDGTPEWSIEAYPAVSIAPGPTAGTWQVPRTPGTARLAVDVQSLFDGTLSRFDEPVDFTVSYLITFTDDNEISILPQ